MPGEADDALQRTGSPFTKIRRLEECRWSLMSCENLLIHKLTTTSSGALDYPLQRSTSALHTLTPSLLEEHMYCQILHEEHLSPYSATFDETFKFFSRCDSSFSIDSLAEECPHNRQTAEVQKGDTESTFGELEC